MSLDEKRAALLARTRFNFLFKAAFYSLAEERGWRVDRYLGTSSHGTIALQLYFRAKGL